jgi:hypothetical protein
VEFDLLREVIIHGDPQPVPLEDGAVLKDGRGDPEAGDNLKLVVTPRSDCYLYAVSVDATGWAQPLFPFGLVQGTNPVRAGQRYEIPENNEWFYLDEYRGIETLFLIASRERREDLDQALINLAQMERPQTVGEGRVEEPDVISRGFAGKRQGRSTTVTTSAGSKRPYVPSSFLAEAASADLVLTRWFRHE